MQHNWNVSVVMKCLKVFLRWRLGMTQNRCLNTVVQNKAFVYSSNLISPSPYRMCESAWLKPDCCYGPCSSLLSGNLESWEKVLILEEREVLQLSVLASGEPFLRGCAALAWSSRPAWHNRSQISYLRRECWRAHFAREMYWESCFSSKWWLTLRSTANGVASKKTALFFTRCSPPLLGRASSLLRTESRKYH